VIAIAMPTRGAASLALLCRYWAFLLTQATKSSAARACGKVRRNTRMGQKSGATRAYGKKQAFPEFGVMGPLRWA